MKLIKRDLIPQVRGSSVSSVYRGVFGDVYALMQRHIFTPVFEEQAKGIIAARSLYILPLLIYVLIHILFSH